MTATLLEGLAQFAHGALCAAVVWCLVAPWIVRRERRLAEVRARKGGSPR